MRGSLVRAHVAGMTVARQAPLPARIRETFTRIGETAGRRESMEHAMRNLISIALVTALAACTAERTPPASSSSPAQNQAAKAEAEFWTVGISDAPGARIESYDWDDDTAQMFGRAITASRWCGRGRTGTDCPGS